MDLDELMDFINNPAAGETKEGKKKKKNKNKTSPNENTNNNNNNNVKLEEITNQKDIVKIFDENIKNNSDANLININKLVLNENTPIVNTNLETIPKQEGELTERAEKQAGEGEEKKKKKKKKKKAKKDPNSKNEKEDEDDKEEEDDSMPRDNPWRKLWDFSGKDITKSKFQDNSTFRVLKNWKEVEWRQTNWPTLDIDQQYPNADYPVGEIIEYGQKNIWRSTSAEKKEMERLLNFEIQSLRKAAEVHRQVRKFAQQIIRPGMRLIDICNQIENMNRFLVNKSDLKCGIAFPTGCSINHVAAHYTPNPGDFRTLEYNDVCKIDYGTHVNGYIIDCAFTVAFNPQFDDLLLAVQDATDTGIKEAGIDVRLCDVGAAIQEVMESYEVVINGKTYPVKSVKNLCGHTIEPYKIHAGKSVPIVKNNDYTKMEEGELYAIETFGSTGKGWIYEDSDCSHYMKEYRAPVSSKFRSDRARQLFNHITKNYSTLAFCRKWLEEDGFTNHSLSLRQLVDSGHINPYPPLSDNPGCYVAQFEHTIFMKPTCKEVLSRGDDY